MKKLFLILCILPFMVKAQELNTIRITDWNNLKKPGFYESTSDNHLNTPSNHGWYWGVNLGHIHNLLPDGGHHGAQILFPVSFEEDVPQMYIRNTNHDGKGMWAKVLHDQGSQTINGDIDIHGHIIAKQHILLSNGELTLTPWDNFNYKGIKIGHYAFRWAPDSWCNDGHTLWQSGFGGIKFFTRGQFSMGINTQGNVGIGTENPQNKLDVAGTIRAQEIKVELSGWADHVFDKDYQLPSLQEVKAHIEEHKHLPGIPSEKQILEDGVNMGEMQAKLLQKIEELTLYVIQLQEQNEKQQLLINQLIEK